ncbi:hypothetical protein [Rhodococcoides yunnanense]|uniref:Uncharacterized protein n=1 Tax=Rhodococcoides yunnanense TaxID=278209 RepID=A0ABU4B6W6_9NOCA|nr:hypothetical protein [Rhodococcus yunnanensis]MDV6259935.1 hypothetical protein [Rhodococcus yunnanensis]
MEFQIHRQARDVVYSVEKAKAVVEVEAIQYSGAVRKAENVVREKVAVTVDYAAPRNPIIEEGGRRVEQMQMRVDCGMHGRSGVDASAKPLERSDLLQLGIFRGGPMVRRTDVYIANRSGRMTADDE